MPVKSIVFVLFSFRRQTKNATSFHQWHTEGKKTPPHFYPSEHVSLLHSSLCVCAFVTDSVLKRTRRRCQPVLECLSLWATLSTRRPSTRRTCGKRWSSWCWIRRTASPPRMVRLSADSIVVFAAVGIYSMHSYCQFGFGRLSVIKLWRG